MYDIYISLRHTPLSMYYLGWVEKFLHSSGVKIHTGFDRPRIGDFPYELKKKIENCPNFIIILTPETFDQNDDTISWMEYEIETAIQHNVNIILLMSADFRWPEELSRRLSPLWQYPSVTIKSGGFYSMEPTDFRRTIDKILTQLIPTKQKESVFISYSTKDSEAANQIRRMLERNHIPCWMAPNSIPAGGNYADIIPVAINNCEIFLLILSKNSQESIWVPKELDIAINNKKAIIPFQIDNADMTNTFNLYLANCQRIIAHENIEEAYFELTESIYDVMSDIKKVEN